MNNPGISNGDSAARPRRAHALRVRRARRIACALFVGGLGVGLVSIRFARADESAVQVASTVTAIDLAAAVRLGKAQSPTLRPSRAAVSGAVEIARVAGAALSTPPRLEVQGGPRVQHGSLPVGPEVTVGAFQDFSLGGYGSARREFSASLEREARAGAKVAEWDAAARAALSWTEARLAVELERIRADALSDAQELLRVAEVRVRSGRADAGESALARAVVGSARAAVLDAEGRRFVAEAELRFATGLAPGTPIRVTGAFEANDGPLDVEAAPRARGAQPDVALSLATADRRARAADLVLSAGKPFLSIGPLVTHEGTGDWIFQARVAVPLPFVNPAALEGAHARSDALVASAEAEERRARLAAEIRIALHEREHARAVRDALGEGALGPARTALDIASKQYAAGSAELPIVLGARRELLDAEQRWAEAVADVHRADIRLSRALGRDPSEPLTTMGKP